MATQLRECFPDNVLEMISNIIGDTNNGLTGTEIHKLLLNAQIEDTTKQDNFLSKRKNLFNSLVKNQETDNCSNNILTFIASTLTIARFADKPEELEKFRNDINEKLAYVGLELTEDGKYREIEPASTISDVQIKVDNLKQELEKRNAHSELFKYCKAELLQNNYFHSVLEANKGLFQKIRDLSGIQKDGNSLIEEVFSSNPILTINNYQSSSEKNEHTGFCNLLKGLCSMFRNTTAHQPKADWEITEQDALEILGIH